MDSETRQFWARVDPAFLAQYEAREEQIRLLQAATYELERAQADADLAKMADDAKWNQIAKDIYADIEQEMFRGEHESGYRMTNHD